jgi:hypothetical protein
MRCLLILLLLLSPFNARASQTDRAEAPRDYSSLLDKSNEEFLRALAKRIREAGYQHVQLVPQMFVAIVEKSNGERTVLIVDYNTMQTLEVDGGLGFTDAAKVSRPETELPKVR